MRTIVMVAAVATAVLLVACGEDQPALETPGQRTTPAPGPTAATAGSPTATVAATPTADGVAARAMLTGMAAVPEGDPDGDGSATVTLNPDTGQVCFTIAVENIRAATAAHIHAGRQGTAGPVVIPLKPPAGGSVDTCVTAEPADVERVVDNLAGFYVNVHNEEFPEGAVRGQLQAG